MDTLKRVWGAPRELKEGDRFWFQELERDIRQEWKTPIGCGGAMAIVRTVSLGAHWSDQARGRAGWYVLAEVVRVLVPGEVDRPADEAALARARDRLGVSVSDFVRMYSPSAVSALDEPERGRRLAAFEAALR